MTETGSGEVSRSPQQNPPPAPWAPPPAQVPYQGSYQAAAVAPYQAGFPTPEAPVGKIRSTGVCILLTIVTLGIYALVWYFMVHEEMKRHTNRGLGGGVALLLAFFVGIVMPYITSSEVGGLYEARGLRKPVGGATGLWYFPGTFILVGPLVWFVKTNGALNGYWRSLGVR